MQTEHIWIVDDDRSIRWVLEKALRKASYQVSTFDSAESFFRKLQNSPPPDAIITDVRMPGMDGFELLKEVNNSRPDIPIIVMTAHSDLDSAVTAYQGGAFEYLPKPFDVDEAVELVKRAVEQNQPELVESNEEETDTGDQEIIGEAPSMQEVFRAIGRLSRSNITVMITGESGTGKELVARALHKHSPRATKPFIAINTAAIPKDLLESELFGHEKGAFTGAQSTRKGRFEQANGGTLFLDEIGDMPAELQTRLLRVLATGEFYRVGGLEPIKVNVRIIAATHQNLESRVKEGDFREDLFHRLNVIRIELPALRERRQDIKLLLRYYLNKSAQELSVEPKKLQSSAVEYLSSLEWPGNVRQLENICRWLTVMAPGPEIMIEDLPNELRKKETGGQETVSDWTQALYQWADKKLATGEVNLLDSATKMYETVMIEVALKHTQGKRQEAARLLGWGRNTLTRKIKELDIETFADDDVAQHS